PIIAHPEPRAPRDIIHTGGITIRELAEKLDVRAKDLLNVLLDKGIFASINQALDSPTATQLAESFNGVVTVVSFEDEMMLEVAKEETKENLKPRDRKSTRLNSSHVEISYAVFCLKKKNTS